MEPKHSNKQIGKIENERITQTNEQLQAANTQHNGSYLSFRGVWPIYSNHSYRMACKS